MAATSPPGMAFIMTQEVKDGEPAGAGASRQAAAARPESLRRGP
jgi:hypothetical protein